MHATTELKESFREFIDESDRVVVIHAASGRW
jgi:hypothetical protein